MTGSATGSINHVHTMTDGSGSNKYNRATNHHRYVFINPRKTIAIQYSNLYVLPLHICNFTHAKRLGFLSSVYSGPRRDLCASVLFCFPVLRCCSGWLCLYARSSGLCMHTITQLCHYQLQLRLLLLVILNYCHFWYLPLLPPPPIGRQCSTWAAWTHLRARPSTTCSEAAPCSFSCA